MHVVQCSYMLEKKRGGNCLGGRRLYLYFYLCICIFVFADKDRVGVGIVWGGVDCPSQVMRELISPLPLFIPIISDTACCCTSVLETVFSNINCVGLLTLEL